MRTAAREDVVSFRTFLRTLVHELGHHLDVVLLELAESFHTHGFFRRESSLVRQLLGEGRPRMPRRPHGDGLDDGQPATGRARRGRESSQLALFSAVKDPSDR